MSHLKFACCALIVVALPLVACSDDETTSASGGQGGATSTSTSASGGSGGGSNATFSVSGTACGSSVSYEAPADAKLYYILDQGKLGGVAIADGPIFQSDNLGDWATYGATHDVYSLNAFSPDPDFAPGTYAVQPNDSFYASRALDGFFFYENTPATLTITTITPTEVDLTFETEVKGVVQPYPPVDFVQEPCTVGGTVILSIKGPWTEYVVPMP